MRERLQESRKAGRMRAGDFSSTLEAGFWDGSQEGQEGQYPGPTGIAATSAIWTDVGNTGPGSVERIIKRVG